MTEKYDGKKRYAVLRETIRALWRRCFLPLSTMSLPLCLVSYKKHHIFTALLVAAIAIPFLVIGDSLLRPLARHIDKPFTLVIEAGDTPASVARRMQRNHIPINASAFLYTLRITGDHDDLKVGTYHIDPQQSLLEAIDRMVQGRSVLLRLTIPEGYSLAQAIDIINNTQNLRGHVPSNLWEGALFPDTYLYRHGEQRATLIRRMRDKADETLQKIWQTRDNDLPIETAYDMLILASIVEKETGQASERARIAAVFHNRLRRGMRLESDPTVIYGITGGTPLGRPLFYSDLRRHSAWNTYRIKGLPPSPICLPGADALQAVAHPITSNELFFVANGTGGHTFAENYEDHQKNVEQWRAWQRQHQNKKKDGEEER